MRTRPALLALLGGLWAGLGAPPAGAQRVEHVVDFWPRIFPVRGPGEIEVRAPSGKVQITAGPEGRIRVRGVLRVTARDPEAAKAAARASNLLARVEGDRVVVELSSGAGSAELWVEAPPHATVRVRARAANIEARALAGPLDLQSKAGNIQVALGGPATVHAETWKGHIEQDLGLQVGARGRALVADGRVGGGGPQVVVSTGQGAVILHAAIAAASPQ